MLPFYFIFAMGICSICGKPVVDGATECSFSCLMQAGQEGFKGIVKARNTLNTALEEMLKPINKKPQQETNNMIKVKHRWMVNRNVVADSIVLSFNQDGIAYVPDVGSNRGMVEFYVRHSKGLAEIIEEEKVVERVAAIPEKKEKASIPEKKVEKKEEVKEEEKKVEKKEEVKEDKVDEKQIDKKSVKKIKPVKKK